MVPTKRWLIPELVIAVGAFIPTTFADTVRLKTGGFINDCRVGRQDSKLLYLRTPAGTMGVPRSIIRRIEKKKSAFDIHDDRRRQVSDKDAKGLYSLALWCKKTAGLRREMHELLARVIALKPDHGGARNLLGYVCVGKEWKKPPPLSLIVQSDSNKKLIDALKRQLLVSLTERDDLRIEGRAARRRRQEKLYRCDVVAKVAMGRRATARFYGLKTHGPMLYAVVKLTGQAEWLGEQPISLSLEGEVPAGARNAAGQAIGDALTRNATKVQQFYDTICERRLKLFRTHAKAKPKNDPRPGEDFDPFGFDQ